MKLFQNTFFISSKQNINIIYFYLVTGRPKMDEPLVLNRIFLYVHFCYG